MKQLSGPGVFFAISAAAFAVAVGFTTYEPIERELVLRSARTITGLDLDFDRVGRSGAGFALEGVRANFGDGALVARIPRVDVAIDGSRLAVECHEPDFIFDPNRYRDEARARTRDAFLAWKPDAHAIVRIENGALHVSSAPNSTSGVTFDAIGGAATMSATALTFELGMHLRDGATSYPITATLRTNSRGVVEQHWSADTLPIMPFDGFLPTASRLRLQSGLLRDVDLTDTAGGIAGGAHLDNVAVALGDHVATGLHGPIVLADHGVGSRGIVGSLAGVPVDVAGEIHGFVGHYRWLAAGAKDATAFVALADRIAGEPDLRYAHLEATAPGLAYAQYGMRTSNGPVAVSVLDIDPGEPTLHFGTSLASDHIISSGERTSAMGLRTGAIAGVNGDYFDIGRTYQPQGLLVKNGSIVRGPTDRAALAIDAHGHVTFAEYRLHGRVKTREGAFAVSEFNDWPPGHASIITPDFGQTLPTAPGTTFVRLEPQSGGTASQYRVTAVIPATSAIAVGFGIAIGPLEKSPLPKVGEDVDVTYRTDPPLDGAVAAIGGGPILVRDGAPYEDPHAPAPDERDYRWPVVALAQRGDGRLYLIAVDGRHPERSIGMTRPEFADLLVRFGAADAMALDSGGSVTLISRKPGDATVSVRNVPSDNSAERWVSDALLLYSSAPPPTIVPAPTPAPSAAVPVP